MAILSNLARVRTATLGVGPVTLGAAVAGYNTFAASGIVNGNVVSYGIMDFDPVTGLPTQTEVGRGTYSAIGPTLARTTILDSTNGGAAINLGGNAQVYVTALAEDFDHTSGSILNVGTNTHAQIDLHLASVANPHATNAAQVGAPALVNPSVIGNFVSFSGLTGAQQDSGVSAASFQGADATLAAIAALADAVGWLHNDGLGGLAWSTPPAGVGGSGVVGQVAEWVTDTHTLQAAKLIAPVGAVLTLVNANAKSITFPGVADDTVALLGAANVFTNTNKINVNSTTALLVEQDGVKDDVFIVDTTNGLVGVRTVPTNAIFEQYNSSAGAIAGAIFRSDYSNVYLSNYFPALAVANANATDNNWALFSFGDTANINNTSAAIATHFVDRSTNAGELHFYTRNSSADRGIRATMSKAGDFAIGYGAFAGLVPLARLHVIKETTTTNAIIETFRLESLVSTASTGGAAGFGPGYSFYAETATDGTSQQQAYIKSSWVDATNVTRKAKLSISAFDTAERLGMEIEASGSAAKLAFYGGTTVVRGAALTAADAGIVNTGDATTDGVINNMRTRINELEARLGSATGVNLFA